MNCPICNKESQCGVEAGQRIEDCWCSKEAFPKELLLQVPKEQVGKSCICETCLMKWKQQ